MARKSAAAKAKESQYSNDVNSIAEYIADNKGMSVADVYIGVMMMYPDSPVEYLDEVFNMALYQYKFQN